MHEHHQFISKLPQTAAAKKQDILQTVKWPLNEIQLKFTILRGERNS